MPEDELWTIEQAAEHIGAATPVSARKTLSRWGVKAVGYKPIDGGGLRAAFRADDVRAAVANRPGRGTRTDLHPFHAHRQQGELGMTTELGTMVWVEGGDSISPLTTIPGVALAPPVGAHITIEGNRYRVTEGVEIEYRTDSYRNDGSRLPDQILVTLPVVPVPPSKGS